MIGEPMFAQKYKYSEAVAMECRKEAEDWAKKSISSSMFHTSMGVARLAITEYLANVRGYTIYQIFGDDDRKVV
jgi:hypothetical protein